MGEEGGRAAEQAPGSDLNQQLRCVEDQQAGQTGQKEEREERGGISCEVEDEACQRGAMASQGQHW